jgi:hypothetical protein
VNGALSESGLTSVAAELVVVPIDYRDPLELTSFGLCVPDDATIVGIEFNVRRNADSGLAQDAAVRLLKDGVAVGVDHRSADSWPMTLTYTTYGGPADTWGAGLTAADLRASGFGLALAPRYIGTAGNDRAHVDSVQARVYFVVPCD